jgi:hypothetical protein
MNIPAEPNHTPQDPGPRDHDRDDEIPDTPPTEPPPVPIHEPPPATPSGPYISS